LSDERKLLARARRFDQGALGQIHDEYYARIFRYALFRTGDREAAEDIASEVFMRLLQGLRSSTGPKTTLAGWLFGGCACGERSPPKYHTPMVELNDGLSDYDDTFHAHTCSVGREELRQALSSLTEEQQHVIALRFGQEMPIQAVARDDG
jgi:RNA polymerase sigma-70 factor (ECF subfamily)